MRKIALYLLFALLPLIYFTLRSETPPKVLNISDTSVEEDIYSILDLSGKGLQRETFNLGVHGLHKLETVGKLKNPGLLTIVDYSQPSFQKRLYVIDLQRRKLLFNSLVAHGRNSGYVNATSFSNQTGSLKSCLGFFITGQTITGAHTGYSLVLNGIEKGINDQALKRAIIIHGADYASAYFVEKNGRLGRSYGCPALPPDINKSVIDSIKEGTCLFIYHPDPEYIRSSQYLN